MNGDDFFDDTSRGKMLLNLLKFKRSFSVPTIVYLGQSVEQDLKPYCQVLYMLLIACEL